MTMSSSTANDTYGCRREPRRLSEPGVGQMRVAFTWATLPSKPLSPAHSHNPE